MKKLLLIVFIVLTSAFFGNAQSVNLVKDLNPGEDDGIDQWNNQSITFKDMLLFAATDESSGLELYMLKDGQLTLVKDINPGTDGSVPSNFILFNNKVYFTAYDATHGEEIWCTDGTSAGTVLAIEAITGTSPSKGSGPGILIAGKNNKLYFSVDGNAYTSDGTTASTTMISGLGSVDFNENFSIVSPKVTTYENGIAFFSKPSSTIINFYSLSASNIPVLLKTVTINQYGTTDIYGVSEVSAGLLFSLRNNTYKDYNGLFVINKADGSVTEIKDESNATINVNRVIHFTNGKVLFKMTSGGIYSTDGTQEGTIKITPGTYTLYQGEHIPHVIVNGLIVFYGDADYRYTKIYISDGTVAGTSLIASDQSYLSNFIASGNTVSWGSGIVNNFKPRISTYDVNKKTSPIVYNFTESASSPDATVMMGIQDSKIYFAYRLKGDGRELYALSGTVLTTGLFSSTVNTTAEYYKLCTLNSMNGVYAIASESASESLAIMQYDLKGNVLNTANVKAGESFVLNTSAPMSVVTVTGNNGSVSYKILGY